jgi:hypothetical protein
MNRKSQLEKFELRQSKMRKDEEVIKNTELKNSTLEKRAGKVAQQHGMSTEDIFMIIARDSAGEFLKMWSNSVENVVRETIQTEVRNVVQQVVQEELASAVRGFMKGLMPQPNIEEMVKDEVFAVFNPEPEFKNGLQKLQEEQEGAFESKLNEMKQETDEYVKKMSIDEEPVTEREVVADEETRQAIIENHLAGNNPTSVKQFKKAWPRNNTLYQKFVKNNKGIRGGWAGYVTEVINSIEEEA